MKTFLTIFLLFISSFLFSQQMIPNSNWIPSDGVGTAQYGKGLFFYRYYRSQTPTVGGLYEYHVYFISNSYYSQYSGTPYRVSTYIPKAYFKIGDTFIRNNLFGDTMFWVLFLGDLDNGVGYLGAIFSAKTPTYKSINFYFDTPTPY